jgi:hypothetical protein
MEQHTTCKHLDISGCDARCECWCDSCQIQYEAGWMKRAEEEKLCLGCGVPYDLTPNSLLKEQNTHFFQPCRDCAERFSACMKLAKLCESCHSYTEGECKSPENLGYLARPPAEPVLRCKNCICEGSEDCNCYNCRSNAYK